MARRAPLFNVLQTIPLREPTGVAAQKYPEMKNPSTNPKKRQPGAMGLFFPRAACSEGVLSPLWSFECRLPRGVILVEFRAKLMEYSPSLVLSKILGCTMIFAESSYLPRRALTLPVARVLHSIFFHFLGWEFVPNQAPARFVALVSHNWHHQKPFRPVLPLGKSYTIWQPPLAYF